MRRWVLTLVIWLALIAAVLLAWKVASPGHSLPQESRNTLLADLNANAIAHVVLAGDRLVVTLDSGEQYETGWLGDAALVTEMRARGIDVQQRATEEASVFDSPSIWLLLLVVFVVVFAVLYVRRARGGTTSILTLRKSRARLLPEKTKARFTDVGGADEAKEDLRDVIDYLKDPSAWKRAGIRLPHGVLLEGPPGCGKTLLARAVAGEANVPFFFVSASEFVEMFVGVGAARVRDMFDTAAKKAPCLLFIDELDAVGRRRGSGVGSAHDEREQTLNQLLVCMDGFETDDRVVVMAATNRPDVLDKALLRPGRLDRILRIPLPDREARQAILEVHAGKKKIASDVSLPALAERLEGVTGADLENLLNEAALLSMRRARAQGGEAVVARADIEQTLTRSRRHARLFDQLDQLLVESASQLAQPTGKIVIRITLRDETSLEGALVWADAAYVKVRPSPNDGPDGTADRTESSDVIVPKTQIKTLEALSGTERVGEVSPDRWAHGHADLA